MNHSGHYLFIFFLIKLPLFVDVRISDFRYEKLVLGIRIFGLGFGHVHLVRYLKFRSRSSILIYNLVSGLGWLCLHIENQ